MGLGIRRIAEITNHKLSEVKKVIDVNKLVKFSSTYPKNFEFLTDFINRKDISPIKYQNENILVLNRYYRKRLLIEDQIDFSYVTYDGNPKYIIISKLDFSLTELKDILNVKHCTFESKLINYLKLKNASDEFLNISNQNVNELFDSFHFNKSEYANYLNNVNIKNSINKKLTSIVNDRFRSSQQKVSPTTNAVFSNIGYLVKDYEGKYLDMSMHDKTFLKRFFADRIIDGTFKLTLTEAFPLYKEEIKDIIVKGRLLLELENNKTKIKSLSRKIWALLEVH